MEPKYYCVAEDDFELLILLPLICIDTCIFIDSLKATTNIESIQAQH